MPYTRSTARSIAHGLGDLADAGVPMNTLPLTPERVRQRIRELKIGWNPEARQ